MHQYADRTEHFMAFVAQIIEHMLNYSKTAMLNRDSILVESRRPIPEDITSDSILK